MMEMNNLKDYQLEIIDRALQVLVTNYDDHDLEALMYSGLELESEIDLIQRKIEMYQPKHQNQGGQVWRVNEPFEIGDFEMLDFLVMTGCVYVLLIIFYKWRKEKINQ